MPTGATATNPAMRSGWEVMKGKAYPPLIEAANSIGDSIFN